MNKDNKILLSLIPYNEEATKLKLLKDNSSFKEIMRAIKYYGCNNIDDRIQDIKKYNTVFCDENNYPKRLQALKIPPMRLQSSKCFTIEDDYVIGLITSTINKQLSKSYLEEFALNMARVFIKSIVVDNFGIFLNNLALPNYTILSSGLENYNFSLSNTTILSAYEPKEKSSFKNKCSMYEVFSALCNSVVVFDSDKYLDINRICCSVLDCGRDLYLSRYCLDCNSKDHSLDLFLNGTPLISNIHDLDDFYYDK